MAFLLLDDLEGVELLDLKAEGEFTLGAMSRYYLTVVDVIVSEEVKFTGSDGCLAYRDNLIA